jgi:hypothetical protein
LLKQPTQERLVLHAVGEVAATTQHQSLVQRPLELAVALLHVPVLVSMRRLNRLPGQTVVTQQRLIALPQGRRTFRPRRDGRRQSVGAVHLRYAAQFPQSVLQALAEALVTLGKADRTGLPIGVGQDEVVDQMVEGRTSDGHTQVGAVGEVAGTQPSGMVNLREEHLLGRSGKSTPLLDASLQGSQLAIAKASGKAALQVGEQGFGLQSRVEPELLLQLRPHLGEGVGPCAVIAVHASHLAGQLAEPAVLACRLGVNAGFIRCSLLGQSAEIKSSESSHLLIGDHPEPPVGAGSG